MSYIEISDLNRLLDNGIAVYTHFMGEIKLGKKYKSPLRVENDPSFSIFANKKKGLYYWKDSGDGRFGDHWDFLKQKFNLSFIDSVNYAKQHILGIGNFGVDSNRVNDLSISVALKPKVQVVQQRAKIIPTIRSWSEKDEDYFQKRCKMSCNEMQDAWYLPASSVEIIKPEKRYIIYETTNSPIYVICFPSGNFKVWRPKEPSNRKWVSNVEREKDFYLLDSCNGGDVLLILAGNRDCAAVRKHLKIDSFALLSETGDLPFELFQRLHVLYKKIFVLYDNDIAGYKGAKKQEIAYGIPSLNHLYKQIGVNDFCEILEFKESELGKFALSLYSEI